MKLGHRLSAAREQEFTKLSIGAELSLQAINTFGSVRKLVTLSLCSR